MNKQEREAARRGARILDQALVTLGRQPVLSNPDFRITEPLILDFPTVVLEKRGVAPLLFLLAPELDVSVGNFSEVLGFQMSDPVDEDAQELIERLLRSQVLCRFRGRYTTIALQVPGEKTWLKHRVFGWAAAGGLESHYLPYVETPA